MEQLDPKTELTEEEAALSALVRAHTAHMYAAAFCVTRNKQDAEDVVSQVILYIMHKKHKFLQNEYSVSAPFLDYIVRRRAYTYLKHRGVEGKHRGGSLDDPDHALPPQAFSPSAEQDAMASLQSRALDRALLRLNERDRYLLEGRFELGLTARELAEELGVKPVTIRTQIGKAKAKLKVFLKEEGYYE